MTDHETLLDQISARQGVRRGLRHAQYPTLAEYIQVLRNAGYEVECTKYEQGTTSKGELIRGGIPVQWVISNPQSDFKVVADAGYIMRYAKDIADSYLEQDMEVIYQQYETLQQLLDDIEEIHIYVS